MKKTSRASLRLLGSVGEPINPEAWEWYHRVVGDEPLPDRRHLVADRNRRHSDHAAARRDRAQARLGDAAVLRRAAADRRRRRQRARRRLPRAISCIADSWPGQMRTVYGDHERFVADLFHRPIRANISPATAAAATRTAITGSPAASTTSSTSPATGMGTAEVESALVAHPKVVGSRRRRLSARHQGPGHLRLCHADGRRSSRPRSCARNWSPGCARKSARSPRPT